jgi:hypothetical protein
MEELAMVGALSLIFLASAGFYFIVEWASTRASYHDLHELAARIKRLEGTEKQKGE